MITQDKYLQFKNLVSYFNIIDISEKININIEFHFFEIKKNKELKQFLINEMKTLKKEEKRKYIAYSKNMAPIFFFLSEKYITYVNAKHGIYVYDHKFNDNFFYFAKNNELKEQNDFYSYFVVFDNKLSLSISNNELNKINDILSFNLTNKALINITRSHKNKFNIDMKTSSKLVSIEFKENTIIAQFQKSLYKSIILDNNCNILEIKFHGTTKKRLSLYSRIYKITNYSQLISSLEDSFELYSLINDSKFNNKTTEDHFNIHIDFIKKFNKHRDMVIKNSEHIINLMNDFNYYKENMFFQNIENINMINFNFYNNFKKDFTNIFSKKTINFLASFEMILFFRAFLLLLEIEDKETFQGLNNYEFIDSTTMNKLLYIKNLFKNTYKEFNN